MDKVVWILVIAIAIVVSSIFFGLWCNKYSCHKFAEIYDAECQYNWVTGCFLKHEGRFIPLSEYEKLLIPNYQMGNAEVKVKIQD